MFSNGHWALSFCTKDGYPSRSAREVTNWWQFFAIVKYFCNPLIVKLFAVSWLRLTSIWGGRGGCIRSKTKTLASKVKHFWEGKIKTTEAKSLSEHGKFRRKKSKHFSRHPYLPQFCLNVQRRYNIMVISSLHILYNTWFWVSVADAMSARSTKI